MNSLPMRYLFLALVTVFTIGTAAAQIRVDLLVHRSNFIRYEPVIATVRITNMTGAELELADDGAKKWFGFNIENSAGTPVPPYNPDYQLSPVSIGPGQSLERSVNITPLYPITEFGIYRVRAAVYVKELGKYFSSYPPLNIEVTEGRLIWQQTVGVPGTGEMRTITVMTHRLPNTTQLYLRVEDKENGKVYCTHQLGRTVSLKKPEIELGPANTVNILQNVAPKSYMYTEVGLNGEVLQRRQYDAIKDVPVLKRNETTGELAVVGGTYLDPNAPVPEIKKEPPPKVGDRPIAAPSSE